MKNLLFISISLLLGCAIKTNAQDKIELTFMKGTKMPEPLYGMTYASDGEKVILAGGRSLRNLETKFIFMFNGTNNEWLKLTASSDLDPMVYGCSVYLGDGYESVMIAGGINNNANFIGLVNDLKLYDLNNYRTTVLGPNPIPAKAQSMAYWKDKVYIFGGSLSMETTKKTQSVEYNKKVFAYNLRTGIVNQLADMPKAKETIGGVINGELFVIGGYNGEASNQIYKYHIASDRWSVLDSLDQTISCFTMVMYNQYLLIIGDYKNMNQLILYDTQSLRIQKFEMNFHGRHMGAAILNENLHVFGGYDPSQENHPSMDQHWYIPITKIVDAP